MENAIIKEIRRVGSCLIIGVMIFTMIIGVCFAISLQRIEKQNKQIIELIQEQPTEKEE